MWRHLFSPLRKYILGYITLNIFFLIRVKHSNWCAAGWLVSLPKRDKTNKERRAGEDLHFLFHLSFQHKWSNALDLY